MSETEPAPGPTHRRRATSAASVAGELLLTVGAVLLLFVIYEVFWTDLAAGRLQDEAAAGLDERWSAAPGSAGTEPLPPPVPPLGEAFARIHLPTLGEDTAYAVVEGTRDVDLRTGPGHYPDTQMPGDRGNAAFAGHRNGSGAVFERLDRLGPCDAIVVETQTQWLTYRVLPVGEDESERRSAAQECLSPEQTERVAAGDYAHVQGSHITTPQAVEVIAPLPGGPWSERVADPGAPLERMLTLTTCHPVYSNAERLIVHAALVETTAKSGGRTPPALKE